MSYNFNDNMLRTEGQLGGAHRERAWTHGVEAHKFRFHLRLRVLETCPDLTMPLQAYSVACLRYGGYDDVGFYLLCEFTESTLEAQTISMTGVPCERIQARDWTVS